MVKWQRVLVTGLIGASVVATGFLTTTCSRQSGEASASTDTAKTFPVIATRKASKPLNLPPELPVATGYTTVDAFPGLIFRAPLAMATPPGEKDRLFV